MLEAIAAYGAESNAEEFADLIAEKLEKFL